MKNKRAEYYCDTYASPIGELTLAADENGNLTGLWIAGQKHHGRTIYKLNTHENLAVFNAAKKWLDAYFAGCTPKISQLPLKPHGTEFQTKVWHALCDIPYGQTTTYGEIAKKLNRPKSSRAVGCAVGRNPISIIIPCHRVIGACGALTGYAGGIDNKIKLLCHERAIL